MSDDEILPEEDELMDRCLEFTNLITRPSMKNERDTLFQFIRMTSEGRGRDELRAYGYTKYPSLFDVTSYPRLRFQRMLCSGEQQKYVNLVLKALKDKSAISMVGSRYA